MRLVGKTLMVVECQVRSTYRFLVTNYICTCFETFLVYLNELAVGHRP